MEISTVLEKSCFECCVAQKFSRQRDERGFTSVRSGPQNQDAKRFSQTNVQVTTSNLKDKMLTALYPGTKNDENFKMRSTTYIHITVPHNYLVCTVHTCSTPVQREKINIFIHVFMCGTHVVHMWYTCGTHTKT